MIFDREMRALFGAESEEHLERLDEGLLRLETAPGDRAMLGEVFRHAHSLKGSARMLGLGDIEALAHAFEDELGAAARGQALLSSERIERLLGALDAVRALVREAVHDHPARVDVSAVLRKLKGGEEVVSVVEAPVEEEGGGTIALHKKERLSFRGEPKRAEESNLSSSSITGGQQEVDSSARLGSPRNDNSSVSAANGVHHPEPSAAPSPAPPPDANWSIETMRVEPAKLDALLSMAGELVVSTTRAVRGRSELVALGDLREGWMRSASASRRVLRELEIEGQTDARVLRELERLVEREGERLETLGRALERLGSSSGDLDRLATVVGEMEASIRGVRLLPMATLFGLFARPVRDMARASGKTVRLEVEGGDTHADKRILESLKDPLMHLIRNSLDHGLETPAERAAKGKSETATLRVRARQTGHQVVVEVEDDGRGLDADAIRASAARKGLKSQAELDAMSSREVWELIFEPGFSTRSEVSELSGRGVGLDIVRAGVQKLRGSVEVESRPGKGCLFRLSLPVTLATTRVLLVRAFSQTFAVPVEAVRGIFRALPDEVFRFGGRETVSWNGRPTSLARLGELLGLPVEGANQSRPCLVLEAGDERVGVLVDELLEEQEIILKPLGPVLADRVRHLAGATILETGDVCLVLHPGELLRLATRAGAPAPPVRIEPQTPAPKSVLLVEDSITVRTQEKRILESAGYTVVTAVDGLDGWTKLGARAFDAVVTDVEMPRLDGFSLSARIRENPQWSEMPIILVTSLSSDDDRKRGVEVGANAYIVKSAFDQKALLDALGRLA